MIDCKEKEVTAIVIAFSGTRTDYVDTVKALVHLIGNQAEPNLLDNLLCTNLIDDMLNQFIE